MDGGVLGGLARRVVHGDVGEEEAPEVGGQEEKREHDRQHERELDHGLTAHVADDRPSRGVIPGGGGAAEGPNDAPRATGRQQARTIPPLV